MLPNVHTACMNLSVLIWPGQARPRQLRIMPHSNVKVRVQGRGQHYGKGLVFGSCTRGHAQAQEFAMR